MIILSSRTRTNTSSPISRPATDSSSSWRLTWALWYSPSSPFAPLGLSFFLRTIAGVYVALRHSRYLSSSDPLVNHTAVSRHRRVRTLRSQNDRNVALSPETPEVAYKHFARTG